MTFVGRLVEEK